MDIIQTTSGYDPSDNLYCTRCSATLLLSATFCSICGERVNRSITSSSSSHITCTIHDTIDIAQRYHITSLVQHRPHLQLFFATDTSCQRPVAIRDIDISGLDELAQERAIEAAQHEYDLLRRNRIPTVMPVIDLHYFQGHLFAIASWPHVTINLAHENREEARLYTLQDLLQSESGLPDEQLACFWMYRICTAVKHLHSQQIVIGHLSPSCILLNNSNYEGLPALMVSWLPSPICDLLAELPPDPSTSTDANFFTAPEALFGKIEPCSDIYSLGAILYMLLTGVAPETGHEQKATPHSLPTPCELNPQLSSGIDEVVMRALSNDPTERFQSVSEMADALLPWCSNAGRDNSTKKSADTEQSEQVEHNSNQSVEDITIRLVPLQAQMAAWQIYRLNTDSSEVAAVEDSKKSEETQPRLEAEQSAEDGLDLGEDTHHSVASVIPQQNGTLPSAALQQLASTSTSTLNNETPLQWFKQQLRGMQQLLSHREGEVSPLVAPITAFFKQLQCFFLGEQQHSTTAAALIETPLRVQPDQSYAIRIHLMGRDEPRPLKGAGLSGLVCNEVVHIEVRSALYQSYAYVVHRADVTLPGHGYAAEVTIPMHPPVRETTGRRERLHVVFMDEMHRPIYEKPLVVEVFVSPLVQSGREGYNVLAVPF